MEIAPNRAPRIPPTSPGESWECRDGGDVGWSGVTLVEVTPVDVTVAIGARLWLLGAAVVGPRTATQISKM